MDTSVASILKNLPLRRHARILDVGAGIQARSFECISSIPEGEIILLEKDLDKLATITKQAEGYSKTGHTTRIHTLACDVDHGNNLPVRNSICDVVLVSHTLRHVVYRESLLKECMRVLAPGGLLVVVELSEDAHGIVTHPDARVTLDEMLEYTDRAGFIIGEHFDTPHGEYGIIGVSPLE